MACVARSEESIHSSEVFVVGGANPSSTFGDTCKLDLRTLQWSKLSSDGLQARYEHSAFIPHSSPGNIYTFGGANESGNLNSLQVYDIKTAEWTTKTDIGKLPKPRTMHCAGYTGDKMYIFSGGHQGADPVSDLALHVFDTAANAWTNQTLKGDTPSARHGHVMAVIGSKLFLHGGMAGSVFYDDLFVVDLSSFKSCRLKQGTVFPCARAGHSVSVHCKTFYVFGGMCTQGALDDLFRYDTATLSWSLLKFDGPAPAPRLDHSMVCTVLPVNKNITKAKSTDERAAGISNGTDNAVNEPAHKPNIVPIDDWQVTVDGDAEKLGKLALSQCERPQHGNENRSTTPLHATTDDNEQYEYVPVCVVLGGMDTCGNIFNDVFVTKICADA